METRIIADSGREEERFTMHVSGLGPSVTGTGPHATTPDRSPYGNLLRSQARRPPGRPRWWVAPFGFGFLGTWLVSLAQTFVWLAIFRTEWQFPISIWQGEVVQVSSGPLLTFAFRVLMLNIAIGLYYRIAGRTVLAAGIISGALAVFTVFVLLSRFCPTGG